VPRANVNNLELLVFTHAALSHDGRPDSQPLSVNLVLLNHWVLNLSLLSNRRRNRRLADRRLIRTTSSSGRTSMSRPGCQGKSRSFIFEDVTSIDDELLAPEHVLSAKH
jgi:hypothetical protein